MLACGFSTTRGLRFKSERLDNLRFVLICSPESERNKQTRWNNYTNNGTTTTTSLRKGSVKFKQPASPTAICCAVYRPVSGLTTSRVILQTTLNSRQPSHELDSDLFACFKLFTVAGAALVSHQIPCFTLLL